MKLQNIYERRDRHELLYRLLSERDDSVNISHGAMPAWGDHVKFVESKPYRAWLFIVEGEKVVGACYLTNNNEIGIFLFREFQGNGLGKAAVKLLLDTHEPLPAIPSVRAGNFLANVSPGNERSRKLFESLGFGLRQLTYDLKK